MDPKIIVIDGKTYHSVNEMPADVRQKYEQAMHSLRDANNNRIPDAFETMNLFADQDRNGAPDILDNLVAGQAAVSSMKIVVDGKEFNGIEHLPPEVRARYEEALRGLDANRNGIPDFVEGMINSSRQTVDVSAGFETPTPRRAPLPVSSPSITPDTSNGWMLVLIGLFIFAACVMGTAAVWYLFLR
ncbi:MAG TPA: hypothetical protein VK900_12995 [Anaerolineales bacterium]|nr:hypothetical protein [Anaerolineales bacterium]